MARESAERKTRIKEVMESVDVTPGRSEAELREELRVSFRERDIDMSPQELNMHAKTLAIVTGPKHLQSIGVLGLVGSTIRGLIEIVRNDDGDQGKS